MENMCMGCTYVIGLLNHRRPFGWYGNFWRVMPFASICSPVHPLKGKDGRNFFFVFCYFSIDYVTLSQIKPCLNDSNWFLSKKWMFSPRNSKYPKFQKSPSAEKRDISKFLNIKWLNIMEMSWASNNKSWEWILGVFDYAQILFKECNLLQICDFWV